MYRATLTIICLVISLSTGAVAVDGHSGRTDYTIHSFQKVQLTDKFWTEGVAMGDLNRDGHMDIVAWPYWYEGPSFTKRHALAPTTQTFTRKNADGTEETVEGYEGALSKNNAYSDINFVATYDFNDDGWLDVLAISRPIGQEGEVWWYENPGREAIGSAKRSAKPWARHIVFDSVGCETPAFVDLFGNGQPVVLCIYGDVLGYVMPDGSNPREKWSFHPISDPLPVIREMREKFRKLPAGNPWLARTISYGDVNGDGRLDVLEPDGWWEQRTATHGDFVWKFHQWPFLLKRPQTDEFSGQFFSRAELTWMVQLYRWPFALSGAQAYVYEFNGDGLPDIISSLDDHRYGLAWFEQLPKRDASGDVRFKPHLLMEDRPCASKYGVKFTQPHAVALADIDGDGLPDIVTGKRFWAHGRNGSDPDSEAPAVLYWFKLMRTADKRVDFIPYLIDDDSGVGYQIAVGDVNGDGLADIAVANKKGTFVFLQEIKAASKEEWIKAQPPIECP